MNLVLDLNNRFSIGNSHFLEKKRNIIIDGYFTKLLYTTDLFTMNGFYFLFPIEIASLDKIMNKHIIKFSPYSKANYQIIQDFAKLEYRIIEYYKQMNNCVKKISNTLSKQMYSGSMKIYRDYNSDKKQVVNTSDGQTLCVLKISGVWETKEDIGITFKLFQVIDSVK
jgi:hypothetical protein